MGIQRTPKRSGFTLIEVLIYIVLFSIIVSGTILVFYQLLRSQAQNKSRSEVESEANFLMTKIAWALSGAQTINSPAPGATSTSLSVSKYNFAQNPLVFDVSSGTLRLSRGGGTPAALNNSAVQVSSVAFGHIAASGTAPEGVQTTLTVSSLLAGLPVVASSTLENTIYLRQ